MKKTIPFALAASLATSVLAVPVTFAEGEVVTISEKDTQQLSDFIKLTGTTSKIEQRTNDTLFTLIEKQDEIFAITVNNDTIIVDNTGKPVELKEGMKFTAYVYGNKPMILIYPPQYTPDVVVVQTEEIGTAELGVFNEDFVNKSNSLKLNIGDKTEITNLVGDVLTQDDIVGKEVIVFYDITTRSIPAQTTPTKIIVLEGEQDVPQPAELDAVAEIINNDHHIVNGKQMVPLRLIAEELGYTVKTTGKGAVLTKGNSSFTITRGEKMYGYNKAIGYFEEAPALLETNKTYVEVDFIDQLKGE